MKAEFLIQRQGKTMVLYAGLLDQAHSQGLVGIDTDLLQYPNPENGNVAVVKASASFLVDGQARSFSGIGDASAMNVAKPMITAIIRMAETRAKARALRDAVNIGAVSLEETGEEELPSQRVAAAVKPSGFVDESRLDQTSSPATPLDHRIVAYGSPALARTVKDSVIPSLLQQLSGKTIPSVSVERYSLLLSKFNDVPGVSLSGCSSYLFGQENAVELSPESFAALARWTSLVSFAEQALAVSEVSHGGVLQEAKK